MIHQFIFANPKPNMSEKDFQHYWLNVHAIKYAKKIKQIKRYIINTRVSLSNQSNFKSLFSGVAEIWLENEKDQLESLQSKEFIEGARIDEPKWAAFWETLVLDTTEHAIKLDDKENTNYIKVIALIKRKPGIPVQTFRNYSLKIHAPITLNLPNIKQYMQCNTRDSWYSLGEPRFDSAWIYSFENIEQCQNAFNSSQYQKEVYYDLENFIDLKYHFNLAFNEHIIIN